MSSIVHIAEDREEMELLRNARSYNEVVIVLNKLKTSITSINNKAKRNFSSEVDEEKTVKQLSLIPKLYDDLRDIKIVEVLLQVAKTLDVNVIHKAKIHKIRVLCDFIQAATTTAENNVYRTLNSFVVTKPPQLSEFAEIAVKQLRKILSFQNIVELTLPSKDLESYDHIIVLRNVKSPEDFILPELVVCIKALSNRDDSFSYSLSFPSDVGEDTGDRIGFTNLRVLVTQINEYLVNFFNLKDIKELSSSRKEYFKRLQGTHSVRLNDGRLEVSLDSGLTQKEIYNIITKIIAVLTVALDIDDPYKDYLYRQFISTDGTKVLQFMLSDRNISNTSALDELKTLLNLEKKVLNDLKAHVL